MGGLRLLRSHSAATSLATDAGLSAAYTAHGAELYGFARRALDDDGQAEEVVQETFLRAWRAGDRFDPDIASLRTWLFAICRNVIVDTARARSLRPASAVTPVLDRPVEDDVDGVLRSWQVEEALRRITADHRTAIVETYFRGRSASEVAGDLGVPVGTVRTRLFYGLRALRLTLEEMGWDDD
ncbi:MAG: sigma-70 family RNA polymerase sigma factor [Acidimicrobiales bacterium]